MGSVNKSQMSDYLFFQVVMDLILFFVVAANRRSSLQ